LKAFEVPGKIVLMGEYSVIEGGCAIVAPIRPPFRYEIGFSKPHPESPYGKYISEFEPGASETVLLCSDGPGAGFGIVSLT
jgi:mevalonate kinase